MCGICGAIDLEYRGRVQMDSIESMVNKIKYRGPDSQGFYKSPDATLGMSRLAVIGLGKGEQPISNEDGTIFLVCNGEIYNYIELKEKLISQQHIFKTDSDVEVLLHLYEEYGTEFLNMLNGQFAFVLYNQKKRQIFCARDHFGIAPFYYTVSEHMFLFGSEIKSILVYPGVRKRINLTGLDQVISFPGLISPNTMFEGIYSLENGHCLIINETEVKNIEYWDMNYPNQSDIDYGRTADSYMEELYERMKKSVYLRLRSDVEVGSYLSGGLDSSFIASMISRVSGRKPFRTFSIGFSEQNLSETKYQQLMADRLQTKHTEIMFNNDEILKRLKDVIYHCECPIKETYNTANLALSECARGNGMKVVMSGEGADELFAGYVGYKFDKFREETSQFTSVNQKALALQEKLWGDKSFVYERDLEQLSAIKRQLYSKERIESFKDFECYHQFVIEKEKLRGKSLVHKRAYVDYKLRLVDHLVCDHGDKMGFGNSVEIRFPFLDRELFEFMATIPPDLLLHDFEEKYIFRECIKKYDVLPKEILNREKFEFTSYGSTELLKENDSYINYLLDYATIQKQGVFDPDFIEKLKRQYQSDGFKLNLPFENDLLLIVITFGMLLDSFQIDSIN